MVEPVTITLASVRLFLSLVGYSKDAVSTINLARNYTKDFNEIVRELELLAVRVQVLVEGRRVLREDLSRDGRHFETIQRSLTSLRDHFEFCAKLLKWYRHEKRTQSCPDEVLAADLSEDVAVQEDGPGVSGPVTASRPTDPPPPPPTAPPEEPAKQKSYHMLHPRSWFKAKSKKTKSKPDDKQKGSETNQGNQQISHAIAEIDKDDDELDVSVIEDGMSEYRNNIIRKVPWIIADKEKLELRVVKIRNITNDLEQLLRRLIEKHSQWVLPQSQEVARMWPDVDRISECLQLLQDAMAAINYGGETEFFLTLRLREDHDDSRAEMRKFFSSAKFSISHDADAFYLRRHFSKLLQDDAHLFVVECRPKSQHMIDESGAVPDITRLDVPPDHGQTVSCRSVDRWGQLATGERHLAFTNIVYYKSDSIRSSNQTLIDLISDPQFHRRMLPVHTVRLAKLILYSHLYLAGVLHGQSQPKPSNYVYYDIPNQTQLWDPTQPLILSPWLSIGFGNRSEDDNLGDGPGVSPSQNFVIAELGLMLWQLGTGQLLDYNENIGVLIDRAVNDTRLLTSRMGLDYTELTQTCLGRVGHPSHLASDEQKAEEKRTLKNCISTLAALDTKLSGTTSLSILELEQEDIQNSVAEHSRRQHRESLQVSSHFAAPQLDEHMFREIGSQMPASMSVTLTMPSAGDESAGPTTLFSSGAANTANGSQTDIEPPSPSIAVSNASFDDEAIAQRAAVTVSDVGKNDTKQSVRQKLYELPVPPTELLEMPPAHKVANEEESKPEEREVEGTLVPA